ncbi:hypothetical protein BY996DRAFT_6427882 [Phakopsora pachyrhizi]|nr:hypothetical protein BY996DRAFT_6427882 [Phakopsora pachyrhizi]
MLPSEKPGMETYFGTDYLKENMFGDAQSTESAFKNLRSIYQAENLKFLPTEQIRDVSTSETLYLADSNQTPFKDSRLKSIQTAFNKGRETLVWSPSTTIHPRIRQPSAAGNKAIVSKTSSSIPKSEKELFFEKYYENLLKSTSKNFYSIQKNTERLSETSRVKFEKSLMEILDPKSPLIKSDLF